MHELCFWSPNICDIRRIYEIPSCACNETKTILPNIQFRVVTTKFRDEWRCGLSYLVRVRAKQQQVERNGCDEVDKEPASKVVHCDLTRVRHHLVVAVHIRSPEVYENVNNEGHVH